MIIVILIVIIGVAACFFVVSSSIQEIKAEGPEAIQFTVIAIISLLLGVMTSVYVFGSDSMILCIVLTIIYFIIIMLAYDKISAKK